MKNDKNYNHIEGKRIYTHPLVHIVYFLICAACFAGATALIDNPTRETMSRYLTVLLFLAGLSLLLLLFEHIWLRKLLCILGEDRLYFFRAELTKTYENSPRKTTILHCSGSLPYSAIEDMKNAMRWERSRYHGDTNNKLVLIGDTFQIAIVEADRSLLKRIRNKQSACSSLSTPTYTHSELEIDHPIRNGLWAEIWSAYETGAFEKLFDDFAEISEIEWTLEGKSVDMLDMVIKKNEHEVCLNIDEDSLYMDAIDNDTDTTVALSEIKTMDNLFLQIRNFVRENT